MHLKNKPPVLVPFAHSAEIEKLSAVIVIWALCSSGSKSDSK